MDRRRTTTVAGCSAALLLLAAACRQLVGIGDAPPTDVVDAGTTRPEASIDAGPKCGIAYAGASCERCLENSCCAQATACFDDPACSSLERCMAPCGGDPACRASCVTAHLVGANTAEDTFGACLASSCSQACGLTCGGMAQFLDDAATSCQSCVVDKGVCSVDTACASNSDCRAIAWCIIANQTLDRAEACEAAHDAGLDPALAVRSAVLGSCTTECALGNEWWCLGHIPPHPQLNPTSQITVTLTDLVTQGAGVGVSVAACSPFEPPCTTLSTGVTDDGGVATVSLQTSNGLGATGYLYVSDGGFAPELLYWGFPLSEPAVRLTGDVIAQNELSGLLTLLGPIDSSRGIVFVQAQDCDGFTSPGMRFSISTSDGETRLYYVNGSSFGHTGPTDRSGLAVFVNVLPGNVTITATPDVLGGKPSSIGQVIAAQGLVTGVVLPPNQ